jgi:hypothetical protein
MKDCNLELDVTWFPDGRCRRTYTLRNWFAPFAPAIPAGVDVLSIEMASSLDGDDLVTTLTLIWTAMSP